tara:strand:+ start:357 stop:944 length:588 start_codon:yes stop_codon:yes gene_type:complete
MAAQDPREIVVGPLLIYVAAAVEAEDDVDTTPSGNWSQLGTSGTENYTEDGITVTHSQTVRESRAVGATGPLKANRQEENLTIAFALMDMNLDELTRLLNNTSMSTDSSPDIKWLGMRRGADITVLSMIAKGAGMSPYGAYPIQLYVPRLYQSGDLSPVFSKGEDVAYAATFSALEYQSASTDEERFGRWVVQNA